MKDLDQNKFADTINQVLENYHGHLESVGVGTDDRAFLQVFITIRIPKYIYEDEQQTDKISQQIRTHLKIQYAIQDEELLFYFTPIYYGGDLDDYIKRNY